MALVASFISEWQTQTDMSWMASEGKEKRGRGRQDAAPSKLPALAKGKMASTESKLEGAQASCQNCRSQAGNDFYVLLEEFQI